MTENYKSRFSRPPQVALDGPAGVGKTTTARALAEDLGLLYVDTGAMYRALAVEAIAEAVALDDEEATTALARRCRVELRRIPGKEMRVLVNGRDVTQAIRTHAASDGSSRISVHPGVRRELVRWQRDLAAREGVVMEGRDIGTVVLPDADAKIFLTATPEERARRRHRELTARGETVSMESVLRDIRERDDRDRTRKTSPLYPAEDAVVVDCTALDAHQQFVAVRRAVLEKLRHRDERDRRE